MLYQTTSKEIIMLPLQYHNRKPFMMYIQIAILCLIPLISLAKQSNNNPLSDTIITPDAKWSKTQKVMLDDTEKSRKMNLFSKCYYYENMDICKKILESLEKECDNGVGLSCGLLAIAYSDGRGKVRNLEEAFYRLQQGCYFGDSLSCMYMRKIFLQHNETQKAEKILESVQKDCDNNGALECLLLSILYENDSIFADKKDRIMSYRQRACDKKFALACGYLDTKGIPKADYESYQRKACDLGMMSACDAFRESTELNIRTQHARLYHIW